MESIRVFFFVAQVSWWVVEVVCEQRYVGYTILGFVKKHVIKLAAFFGLFPKGDLITSM